MKRNLEITESTPNQVKRRTPSNKRIGPYLESKRLQFNNSFSAQEIANILADVINDDEDLDKLQHDTIEMFDDLLVEQLADLSEFNLSQPTQLPIDEFYGLPIIVKRLLQENRGIQKMYEWQEDLLRRMIATERNLIYCVPTSGGKTLVAEMMIFRELMLHQRNVVLILPYISIVQEKIRSLIPFSLKCDFTLEEYAGTKGKLPCPKRRARTLYIATIEKGHLILSSLIEENRLDEIGLIVIDELHMIGDGTSRGAILESLIVKVKLAKRQQMTNRLRLIGMSATLSNFKDISRFLAAEIVERDFRPVELVQYVKLDDKLFRYTDDASEDGLFEAIRTIPSSHRTNDPENLKALVEEVLPQDPTLIFAPTKVGCENIASMLSEVLNKKLYNHNRERKIALLNDLCLVNSGQLCPIMKKSIPFGIAYHHSGLTSDERELIESAFLDSTISCIICTSTLAAGINLPAQRVIIRSPFTGREFLTASMYRQMCGRAGRAGMCNKAGESILIINKNELVRCRDLFKPLQNVCHSSFAKESIKSVSYLILVLIHLKLVVDIEQTKKAVADETLFGIQSGPEDDFRKMVDESFMFLQKSKLIRFDESGAFSITAMGRAAVNSLFDLDKCERIYDELLVAQNGLNLNTNLHLIYICTFGYSESDLPYVIDRQSFFDLYLDLNDAEMKSSDAIGINGGVMMNYNKSGRDTIMIKRFHLTMIIYYLWEYKIEMSAVARKFKMHRGNVQSIINQFTSAAGSLLRFVIELPEFWGLRNLVPTICERLTYCSTPELIPLMELPHVRMPRAKALFNAGFKTLEHIAQCPLYELCAKIEKLSHRHGYEIIQFAKKKFLDRADELEMEVEHLKVLAQSAGQKVQTLNPI